MSRGYPSMTTLLALLAFAGYQNRDKIAEMLRGMQRSPTAPLSVIECFETDGGVSYRSDRLI